MKLSLMSPSGIAVQAQTTHFETVHLTSPTGPAIYETAPVVHVGPSLIASLKQSDTLASSIVVNESAEGSVGIVYLVAGDEVAALIVDLGEVEVRDWVRRSRTTGVIPLLFYGDSIAGLLKLPLGEQFEGLSIATPSSQAQFQRLHATVTLVVELFEDEQVRARHRDLASTDVRRASVNLVVSARTAKHDPALH